jgi:hypothetical protein
MTLGEHARARRASLIDVRRPPMSEPALKPRLKTHPV